MATVVSPVGDAARLVVKTTRDLAWTVGNDDFELQRSVVTSLNASASACLAVRCFRHRELE